MSKNTSLISLAILCAGLWWATDAAQAQTRKNKSARAQKAKAQPTPTPTPTPTPPTSVAVVPRPINQPNTPPPVSDKPVAYKLKGKVLEIFRKLNYVTVEHENIPGYMEAMAMKFPLKDVRVYNKLKVGDVIEATLWVSQTDGRWWLDDVVIKRK